MQRLPYILILLLGLSMASFAQNPHGSKLKVDCNACHTSGSWSYTANEKLFTHSQTSFALEGQHAKAECKDCHNTLVFDEAENTCVACHTDVHSMSVGNDCARCHTASNWLVDEIPELHEQNGFPLVGSHRMAACTDCHQSETNLRWDRIGNDCAMCHMPDYNTAQNPNHMQSGFSTDCAMCHDVFATNWVFYHELFFPILSGNHAGFDCNDCHTTGNTATFSCIECHEHKDAGDLADEHDDVSGYSFVSSECYRCHPDGRE